MEGRGRCGGWGDFINDVDEDELGHGTHVAGIIGGQTLGVAPRTRLVALKVFSGYGEANWGAVLAAIEWYVLPFFSVSFFPPTTTLSRFYGHALKKLTPSRASNDTLRRHATSRSVINFSLGGPPFDPIDAAIASASSPPFNIIVVVTAGSSGSRVSTMSPARCPSAITVGSIDSSDTRSGFSNYGPEISVFAPGEGILSSFHPGDKGGGDNETAYMSRMSMASPFVAGLAAYVMDLEGSKTPAEMRGVIEG